MFEQPKRALVVEDEAKTAAFLRDGLRDHGWSVDVAKDGSEGLRLALKHNYDLLLLDVMLPTLDGWTILRRLRAEGRLAPAVFLTARDELSDRIKGLDLGADDYLVKPFAFSELLARIRSILRRGQIALRPSFGRRHLGAAEHLARTSWRSTDSRNYFGCPSDYSERFKRAD